jgi:hypothetical protein
LDTPLVALLFPHHLDKVFHQAAVLVKLVQQVLKLVLLVVADLLLVVVEPQEQQV